MNKIIMCKGLVASGKTTWSKQYCKENKNTIRINKDDIRALMGCEWSGELEAVVVASVRYMARKALLKGFDVIIDDTNFNPVHERTYKEIAWEYGANFEVKEFNTDLKTCIQRDQQREKPVGKDVIEEMWNKYIKQKEI